LTGTVVPYPSPKRRLRSRIAFSRRPRPVSRPSEFFLALVRTAGNPEHVLAFESLAGRIGPVQRLATLMLDAIGETDEIVAALRQADTRRLRRALVRYHRRRMQIAPDLIERLYSGDQMQPPTAQG
jgi:DNA-binding FadR family transcriptional regulator